MRITAVVRAAGDMLRCGALQSGRGTVAPFPQRGRGGLAGFLIHICFM